MPWQTLISSTHSQRQAENDNQYHMQGEVMDQKGTTRKARVKTRN